MSATVDIPLPFSWKAMETLFFHPIGIAGPVTRLTREPFALPLLMLEEGVKKGTG